MQINQANFLPWACIFKHCDQRARSNLIRTSKHYQVLEIFILVKMNCKVTLKKTCKKLKIKKISIRDLRSLEIIQAFCHHYLKYISQIPSNLTLAEFNRIQSNFKTIDRGRMIALYGLVHNPLYRLADRPKSNKKEKMIVIGKKKPTPKLTYEKSLGKDFFIIENKKSINEDDSKLILYEKTTSTKHFIERDTMGATVDALAPEIQGLSSLDLLSFSDQYLDPLSKFDFLLSNLNRENATNEIFRMFLFTIDDIKKSEEARTAINQLIQALASFNITNPEWTQKLQKELAHL